MMDERVGKALRENSFGSVAGRSGARLLDRRSGVIDAGAIKFFAVTLCQEN